MKHLKISILIIVFFVTGFLIGKSYNPVLTESPPGNNQIQNAEDISFMFIFDETNILTSDLAWEENLDLFNATEQVANENTLEFKSEDYGDLGILVSQIGDRTNGDDNAYWQYWVNNKQIQVAADTYVLDPGDIVSWQFRKSEY